MNVFKSDAAGASDARGLASADVQYREPSDRPTICFVLHTMHVGGGEVLAREMALQHTDLFRPVFALLDDLGDLGRDLRENGFLVKVLGRRPGFDLQCGRRLGKFLARQQVSLIHAHQYGPLLYAAIARLPRQRVPILFTEHGRDYPDYRRWKRVHANRLLLSRRDHMVAVGQCVKDALVHYEGMPSNRVEVIYNGRDLSAYAPDPSLRDRVRAELGLNDGTFAIMQVARLNRLKDHPTALRAMSHLVKQHPEAKLILIGDGEERQPLESLLSELKLDDFVLFLGSRDDVPRLLQAADAFLLSSITEGIPLTLIEAMATGVACVATSVGGIPEVIVDQETGLLAEAGNDADLAARLGSLILDPSLRAKLAAKGRERVLQRFDAEKMQSRYRELYRQMTGLVEIESTG